LQPISWRSQGEALKKLHGEKCVKFDRILKAQWFARDSFKFEKRYQLLILYSLRQTILEPSLSAAADQRNSQTPQNQCERERVNFSDES
jgi:hypothetical protein